MFAFKSLLNIPRFKAVTVALTLVAVMGCMIIPFEWLSHMSVVAAIVILLLYGLVRGLKYQNMQDGMVSAVEQGMGTICLFFFIGLMVSALMMSGVIPALMYYGFGLVSPTYFYFSAPALCSVIGISIGSSLMTCTTVGVAFVGMAAAFHADMAVTAGTIVSGTFLGDKMSPLSDTIDISASIVDIDLFEHIKNAIYAIVPAWLISTALMLWLLPNVATHDMNSIEAFRAQLGATGLVHAYSLIPFALLVILALIRVNAIVAVLFTIVVALVVTYFHNTPDLKQLGTQFYNGYKLENETFKDTARLIPRGGLESVLLTQAIMILDMSLGGLLFSIGVIPSLLETIHTFLANAGHTTFNMAMTSVGVNFLIGEQHLSTLLSGETFKPVYDKLGPHLCNLAHTLEDVGTVINSSVPWSIRGVFISHALGVPVWEYLPYAFFYCLSLALTLVFGQTGLTLSKK